MSLKPDPQCIAVDAFQQDWSQGILYAFPPFNLIGKVLKKVRSQRSDLILVAPVWVTQLWYPLLLELAVEVPILLPKHVEVLENPEGEVHPLLENQTLQLSAWAISGQKNLTNKFLNELHTYKPTPGHWQPGIVTTQPGRNLVPGVMRESVPPS